MHIWSMPILHIWYHIFHSKEAINCSPTECLLDPTDHLVVDQPVHSNTDVGVVIYVQADRVAANRQHGRRVTALRSTWLFAHFSTTVTSYCFFSMSTIGYGRAGICPMPWLYDLQASLGGPCVTQLAALTTVCREFRC